MTFRSFLSLILATLAVCGVTLGSSITSASTSPSKVLTITSTIVVDPKTTTAPKISNCPANCTITYYEFGKIYWTPIELSATYTHTVILVVDEEHHTTRTSTKLVAIPPSANTYQRMPTNSAGTAIANLGKGTFLTYPTNTILYPTGVPAGGTYNTSSRCVTLPATITWPASALSSLTQESPTFPAGETDRFGTLYTIANKAAWYPSAFLEAQEKSGIIPTQCNPVSVAPASAVQGVLVLTSTSISTIQNTKTTEQTSKTIADPIKQTTTPTAVVPTQSSSVISSTKVSPATPPTPALPVSTKPSSSMLQSTTPGTTNQPSLSQSTDTKVITPSSIVPKITLTTATTAPQPSAPSTGTPPPTAPAPSTSGTIPTTPPPSPPLASTKPSSSTSSSTGMNVGDYIINGLGGFPASPLPPQPSSIAFSTPPSNAPTTSSSSSTPSDPVTSSTASSTSTLIPFSFSIPSSTSGSDSSISRSDSPPTQVSINAGRRVSARRGIGMGVSGVIVMFLFYV